MSCIGKKIYEVSCEGNTKGPFSNLKKVSKVEFDEVVIPHYKTFFNNNQDYKHLDSYSFDIAANKLDKSKTIITVKVSTVQ